jgi:hypothetical protein
MHRRRVSTDDGMVIVELVAPPYLDPVLNLIPSIPPTPDALYYSMLFTLCLTETHTMLPT